MNSDPGAGATPGFTFAHLSDLHLSTPAALTPREWLGKRALSYLSWRRKRQFEHRAEVLEALRAELAAAPPDQILISGDLTQLGQPEECIQGRRWLDSLGSPARIGLVPGNHDCLVAAPWATTLGRWQPWLSGDAPTAESSPFPSLRRSGAVACVGLSSALPTAPLLATGRVGAAQLARLESLLVQLGREGRFRVLYLHHAPVPGADRWRKRLVDAPALAAVLARTGVELVLHGHHHRTRETWLDGPLGRIPVHGVASASALGGHGEAAGYSRYRLWAAPDHWRVELERRRYRRASSTFARDEVREFSLPRYSTRNGAV